MALPPLRDYQQECIETVTASEDLNKLVNIFCGLGKSRIMFELLDGRYRKGLKFVVMSNLNLMRQFCADYLHGRLPYMPFCTLEDTEGVYEATTDAATARDFMTQHEDGIIAVTYHSLKVLTDALGDFKPTVFFDESHNLEQKERKWAVTDPRFAERLCFSATPSENNGTPLYSYSYAEALEHEDEWGQPQPFAQDVRLHVGSYVDNGAGPHDNVELLIKTAVLTGNMRCLSFHSSVKGPDPDSVLNFAERCKAQLPIVAPSVKWRVETLYSDMPQRDRLRILQEFDATPDDEIFILCSCETISEGVDTKKCNLVAFIAAVRSYYKIVQKFGRAVRLQAHDRPATILLPFWVNPAQFTDTMTKEERDAVPRTIYAKGNPLFDFYAAVREGDPELLELFQNMYRGPQTQRLKHYADLCGNLPRLSWEEAVQEATGIETDDIAMAARESTTTIEVHPRDGPVEQHEGAAAVEKTIVEMEKDRFVVVPKDVTPAPRENRVVYDTFSPVLINVNFNEELGTAVLEYEMSPEHFEQRIQDVKAFYEVHGEPKQKGKRPNEIILASWIVSRRQEKRKKKLSPERIARIEEEFKDWWSWQPLVDYIERMLSGCKDFFDKHGFSPKINGEHETEKELADWIGRIRQCYKNGENMALCKRIENLFPWWIWVVRDQMHEERIEQLHKFWDTFHEHPKFHGDRLNEASLASWIHARRIDKREKLQLDLCKRIEDEFNDFWVWEPKESKVEKLISELQRFDSIYYEGPKNGGCRENEDRLARWIDTLRQDVKQKKRLELWNRLDKMFKWWSIDPWGDHHRDNLKKLKAFRSKHQKLPTARGTLENEKELATWLTKIRTLYKDNKSTDITDLVRKECPWFSWDPKQDLFEKNMNQAKEFISTFKCLPITGGKRKNEKKLASWMNNLRATNNRGDLEESTRLRITQDIPSFDWYPSKNPYKSNSHDTTRSSMDEDTSSAITEDGADSSLDSVDFAPPAESEPEERREKRPRDDGLDRMDKDALIAIIRDKRSREGYTAPNPVNKDEINQLFSNSLPRHRGLVLFLDHTDFKTATALQAAGVEPRDMLIPQRDRAIFKEMRRHPDFGDRVVHGAFNDILSEQTMPVRGIYADFMGAFHVAEAFVQACAGLNFLPQAIIAVTISLRNPDGTDHLYQDVGRLIGLLNLHLDTVVITDPASRKTIPSMVYGNGAPMATVIQRRRN